VTRGLATILPIQGTAKRLMNNHDLTRSEVHLPAQKLSNSILVGSNQIL
jgi:hypothetical protein